MPRRSKLDLETIRAVANVECPHCHELLTLRTTFELTTSVCDAGSAARISFRRQKAVSQCVPVEYFLDRRGRRSFNDASNYPLDV
jgi:hypothetical protein